MFIFFLQMIIKKVGLNLLTDLEKTTHYTTHAELVCKNLIELIQFFKIYSEKLTQLFGNRA